MSEQKPWFCECCSCGERWKLATLPMNVDQMKKFDGKVGCPNCGESGKLKMCPTSGERAVTKPRTGKRV